MSETIVTATIRVLVVLEVAVFLFAAMLHRGIRIPIGFTVLAEPQIIGAAIVESVCGLFLAVSAYALFARGSWAWVVATAAHVFALAGVLLGMFALAQGWGPRTESNDIYHRVMMLLLIASLLLLATPIVRAALGRSS